jgi:hypothetical protein
MRNPAKASFSMMCTTSGTCGALGLSDQDISGESDMAQSAKRGGDFGEGRLGWNEKKEGNL